jgi:hypothetical protein
VLSEFHKAWGRQVVSERGTEVPISGWETVSAVSGVEDEQACTE